MSSEKLFSPYPQAAANSFIHYFRQWFEEKGELYFRPITLLCAGVQVKASEASLCYENLELFVRYINPDDAQSSAYGERFSYLELSMDEGEWLRINTHSRAHPVILATDGNIYAGDITPEMEQEMRGWLGLLLCAN